jgi:uncharacterized HhH-GPD family protein
MAAPTAPLAITGDPEADELLNRDALALLIGMLLDQQIPMEWAFMGPLRLKERLGGSMDTRQISEMDPDELVLAFRDKPSLHRYPKSMAERTHALCTHLVEHHGGDAAEVWKGAADGADLFARLLALPGYGEEKARIFCALLAKRFGVRPAGWEEQAGPFADDRPRSVADIDGPDALAAVRAYKKELKAAGKGKGG